MVDERYVMPFPQGIQELPDTYLLRAVDENVIRPPHEIITHDPLEIVSIVEELADQLCIPPDHDWRTNALPGAAHEGQHGEAAHLVYHPSLYGVRVLSYEHQIAWEPFTLPLGPFQKIELACVVGYPSELSTYDKGVIRAFGYNGVQDVAEHALNRDLDLPLPLSYQPPMTK